MAYVDTILYEFKGDLSINDIYHMTYKELGYLRKHRAKIYEEKAKNPSLTDAIETLAR
jgi:hypothetical protein